MSIEREEQPNERLRLASSESCDSPLRLKRLARDLRECAQKSSWPDVVDKLIDAAESLEFQAVVAEADLSQQASRLKVF